MTDMSERRARGVPSSADPPQGEAEMVAIEHEGAERAVNGVVIAVPLAAVVLAGWLAWGGTLHWQDLVVLAITYTLTGHRDHGRLPPPVHAPQLQDHARAACGCSPCSARWRSRGR